MDIDIANLLFPNIVTVIVQLLATGVIYLLYKRYLHEPVQTYLTNRANLIASELQEAEAMRDSAKHKNIKAISEYQEAMDKIKVVEQQMIKDAQAQKKSIIASAQTEIDRRQAQLEQNFQEERAALYREAQQYVLEVAVDVNRKVLANVAVDDTQMMDALAKEMNAHDYKH